MGTHQRRQKPNSPHPPPFSKRSPEPPPSRAHDRRSTGERSADRRTTAGDGRKRRISAIASWAGQTPELPNAETVFVSRVTRARALRSTKAAES